MSIRKYIIGGISLVIFIALYLVLYNSRFMLNTDKSTNINEPVAISAGETIDIKVLRGKSDWKVYAYFDNDEDSKVKLTGNLFSYKGSIKTPQEKGIHSLTIKTNLLEKKTFYYIVE